MTTGVCLSVRPSVWLSVARTEGPRKPKIGRIEVHHTDNPLTYSDVKRSKVKVTRPINTHTVNVKYLPNGKAYELQTWNADEGRRPVSASSATCAVISNVKG